MLTNRTYVVTSQASFSILPKRKRIQFRFRHHSTSSMVTKLRVLEFKQHIGVRIMTKKDLRMVMSWSKEEGWNPGKYEVESLYAADPHGYKMLEVDGKPVASLASIKYSSDLAFLGLYIVRPGFRGKGYGKFLWDISMGTIVDCQSMGLNSVLAQVDNYRKSGFLPYHLNTRWRGVTIHSLEKPWPAQEVCLKKKEDFSFLKLADYDAKIFGSPRAAFLNKWLAMPESHVLAAVDGGVFRGYGVISAAQEGYKIAPLFADNEAIAEKLYRALCHWVDEKKPIYLDTVETNPVADVLAKRFGLKKTFNTLRMYKGPPPKVQNHQVFGLTTLEIG